MSSEETNRISACVITHNEERNIRRCLDSLDWCDEIIVVDSFSDDRTVEICKSYTDRVYQHEWQGYIGQRNLIRDMATYSWVLFLDADEQVSDGLREEILHEKANGFANYTGYEFPRLVFYLGKWIRRGDWYPDVKLRLFMKAQGRILGQEPHDHVEVDGRVKRLKHPLHHYTYDDIWHQINTMNKFSGISAQAKFDSGTRFRYIDFLFRPFWRFIKGYFLKLGVLDGLHGLLIASISSFGVAIKYAKLWETQFNHRNGNVRKSDRPPGT